MSLKVDQLSVYCLQDPQANYVRFEGSYQNIIVVAHGSNGLIGVSETDSHPRVIREIIKSSPYNSMTSDLASVIEGQTLDDPRELWQTMYRTTRWYGRHGAVIHAISAVDIALWDLYARSQGKYLFEYFGQKQHNRIPAYATIYPMAADESEFSKQVLQCLDQGFKRIKICVEPWWQDHQLAIHNLQALRALVGKDIELMLDVALEFDHLAQLQPFLTTLEQLDFKWIEAPFDLDNLSDHKALKALTSIPIGVGDLGFTTCKEFKPYLAHNAFDIAQPDFTMFGGVSEIMALQLLLQKQNKRLIPHSYNTDITLAVNAHYLATQSILEPLEYSTSSSLLRQHLVKNRLLIQQDGMIHFEPEQYGLGIELDWDIIRRCEIP